LTPDDERGRHAPASVVWRPRGGRNQQVAKGSQSGFVTRAAAWLDLVRWREWVQSKLLFVAAATLLLAPDAPFLHVLAALGTVSLWAACGYASNEIADRTSDARAGKRNRAAALDGSATVAFVVASAGLALGWSFAWAAGAAGPVAVAGGLALAHVYSHPPLRLKERGLVGLVAAAAAQWLLPVVAVAALRADGWMRPATWAVALLGLALGIRWMGVHQMHDRDADRRAAVRTFGATGGSLDLLLRGALAAEVVLLGLVLVLAWPSSRAMLVALAVWLALGLRGWRDRTPLRARLATYGRAPLAELYFLLLPLALALQRAVESPIFLLLAPVLALLGVTYVLRILVPQQGTGQEAVCEGAHAKPAIRVHPQALGDARAAAKRAQG